MQKKLIALVLTLALSVGAFAQNKIGLGVSALSSESSMRNYILRVNQEDKIIDFALYFDLNNTNANNKTLTLKPNLTFAKKINKSEKIYGFVGASVGSDVRIFRSSDKETEFILKVAPAFGFEYFMLENLSFGLTFAPYIEFDFTKDAYDTFSGFRQYSALNIIYYVK